MFGAAVEPSVRGAAAPATRPDHARLGAGVAGDLSALWANRQSGPTPRTGPRRAASCSRMRRFRAGSRSSWRTGSTRVATAGRAGAGPAAARAAARRARRRGTARARRQGSRRAAWTAAGTGALGRGEPPGARPLHGPGNPGRRRKRFDPGWRCDARPEGAAGREWPSGWASAGGLRPKDLHAAAEIRLTWSADRLELAQDAVRFLRALALALLVLALGLFALAVYVARGWRREALRQHAGSVSSSPAPRRSWHAHWPATRSSTRSRLPRQPGPPPMPSGRSPPGCWSMPLPPRSPTAWSSSAPPGLQVRPAGQWRPGAASPRTCASRGYAVMEWAGGHRPRA